MGVRAMVGMLALAILASSCATARDGLAPAATASAAPSGALGEQRHEAGSVTIVAAWSDGASSLRVAMDTHSVDLDGFDLKELARVRIDGGPWIAPSAWAAPAGGHHRSGTLTFAALDAGALGAARVVELEIRDVAVPSHLLRWERAR